MFFLKEGENYSLGNIVEQRVQELMKEGKESPIRGWSAREISNTIEEEFDEYARDYAWSYILKQCGHGDK